jgi:hypothetical protein
MNASRHIAFDAPPNPPDRHVSGRPVCSECDRSYQ